MNTNGTSTKGRSSSGQDIRLSNGEHGFESRTPYQVEVVA